MLPDEFPDHSGPIGAFVSGGADSALMLYLLMKKHNTTIHVFTTAVGAKEQQDVKCSTDVIKECIRLTGNKNVKHHISYIKKKSQTPRWLLADLPKFYLENNLVEAIYFGMNEMPPKEISKEWSGGPGEVTTNRDPGGNKNEYMWPGWVIPWINLNKKDIASIYQKYNLESTLFPLTRSCIEYTPGVHHCGRCWWCRERIWGFEKI